MAAASRPAVAGGHPAPGAATTPRPIPIRTVPRAAIETLVARLVADGAVPAPVVPEAP